MTKEGREVIRKVVKLMDEVAFDYGGEDALPEILQALDMRDNAINILKKHIKSHKQNVEENKKLVSILELIKEYNWSQFNQFFKFKGKFEALIEELTSETMTQIRLESVSREAEEEGNKIFRENKGIK